MLVLSRRPNDRILFPNLGITVHILRVDGNVAKVGIEAPPEVTVLRHELAEAGLAAAVAPRRAEPPLSHALRNRLNTIRLTLAVFQQLWQAGRTDEANANLTKALELLAALDRETAPPAPPVAPVQKPKVRTLVVEDNTNERQLLAQLLSLQGCECETAADGLDALDYLSSHRKPDVVLLDLMMPRCDGARTLTEIRRNPDFSGLKVFAISGTSPQEMGLSTGPGGVDAWFPKPVNTQKLFEAIQNNLGVN